MANYQMWNTWGRTRSPKNLNGANGNDPPVTEYIGKCFLDIATHFNDGLKYRRAKRAAKDKTLQTPLHRLTLGISPDSPQHKCHPIESIDVMR